MHAPAHVIRALADELGERFLDAGPTGTSVERLVVVPALAGNGEFRRQVVHRAKMLAASPARLIARVLDTQAPTHDPSRLSVTCEMTSGERLSSLVARRRDERRPLTVGQVFYLLRGVVAAVRELHSAGSGVCHGALGTSRFVLATDGRLVLHDCVFGSALATLGWPASRLHDVLGLRVPELADIPAFTPLTDQYQLGLLALHLVTGSPVAAHSSAAMAAACSDARLPGAGSVSGPLPEDLRSVIVRMLLLSPEGPFRSLLALERALDSAVQATPSCPPEPPEIAIEEWSERVESRALIAPALSEPSDGPDLFDTGKSVPPRPADAAAHANHTGGGADLFNTGKGVPARFGDRASAETAPQIRPWWEPRESEPLRPATAPAVAPSEPAPAQPVPHEAASALRSPAVATADSRLALPSERDRQPAPAPAQWSAPPASVAPRPGTGTAIPVMPQADQAARPSPAAPSVPKTTGIRLQLREEPEQDGPDAAELENLYLQQRLRQQEPPPEPSRSWTRIAAIAGAIVVGIGALGYYFGAAEAFEAWRKPPRGHLRLESKPIGARVIIDGADRGHTPLTLTMAPGNYRVELSLGDEFKAMTVPVENGNEAYQLVSLYPPGPPGTLEINTAPPGVAVTVDGEAKGKTPVTVTDVAPGEHVIVAESDVAKVERTVEVLGGAAVPVELPLSGTIELHAPFDVTIYDRAKSLGTGRTARIESPAGRRVLSFVNDELQYEEERTVEVPAGAVARVDLAPPNGVLNFTADTETQVFLDGRPLGSTPLSNVSVALGSHEVTYRHDRWGEQRYSILVTLGSPARLHAVMESKAPKITVTRPPPPPPRPRYR